MLTEAEVRDDLQTGSQQKRDEVVAGIRALADLIEQNTSLPVPQNVTAQFSVLDELTDAGRALICGTAAQLGIALNSHGADSSAMSVTFRVANGYSIDDGAYRVQYTVYGNK